jgi:hypothetical protein
MRSAELLNETDNFGFISSIGWALDSFQCRNALNQIMLHKLEPSEKEPLKELMITYKISIITELLTFIKDNDGGIEETTLDIQWFLDGLYKLDIRWPELAIIQKSFPRLDYES